MVGSFIKKLVTENKKQIAVLVDPDNCTHEYLDKIIAQINQHEINLVFIGGSLLENYALDEIILTFKRKTKAKVVLFPGSAYQISDKADALLFLSLISGRNPELLIGQQVLAAPRVKETGIEVLPTGYMIVDGGKPTTASYMSGAIPLPRDKAQIAGVTALAGKYLGLRYFYLDAGSGATYSVSPKMVEAVKKQTQMPLIVGGGIRDAQTCHELFTAGADILVVGNLLEENPEELEKLISAYPKSSSKD